MRSLEFRPLLLTILLYTLLVLAFTLVSLYTSPAASQTGKLRSADTIPSHLLLLGAGGVVFGVLTYVVYRRLFPNLVLLIPCITILTDLDHLPSAIGLTQPVRPAHSLVLVAIAFVLVVTIIRRLDFSFAVLAGFFVHDGIDTGVFAPFSPFSFEYVTITDYRWIFLLVALGCSLASVHYAKKALERSG